MRKDSFDEDFFSLTNKKWSLKEYSEKDTEYISQSYEVSPLVAKLLSIRKVNLDDIISYISPSLKESLPDPYVLADMEKACERLYQAIINKERIAVFGDYDVDGSTSTSTLINYFKQISVNLKFHIPDRFSEGYGPSVDTFSNFKKRDVKIIFTVDCGTMAFSEIEYAREQGMDVIVLDHHIPEIKLPKATAIINPNRMDDNSGLNYLSAVGVTYMFIIGLNRKLRREDWFKKNNLKEPNLIALLDLVALGTVCDAVPLKGLNRILVSKGIDVIQKRLNPGLNSLIEKSNIKSKVSVHDLGFKIGPRINAGGRLGFSNFGTDLLTESEKSKIDSISNDLDKFNSERRTIESYVLDQAIAQVDDKKLKNKLLIVSGEGWHEGVIGIIASRLKDKFNKPSIVFSINNGEAKGSGRSIKGIDLGQLVISAVQSNLLKKGGGHSMAAGLTIDSEKIEELEKFFEKQLTNKVINTNTSANTSVDGTGLPDDQKSLITNPDGSKGSDNTGGFQRPDFVPPPGGNQGPKDDGSGSEVTAPSDSSKVESGSDIIPPPSVPDTVKVVPTDNKPSSSTKTDLEDYNKKVKATQDSLEIEKRKSDYDKILNNLLQKQGSAVEESEVEETVSKADTLMSKIAQDPAYGVATPTGQSPIWTHGADSKRGKEILKSMKLDPAQYDATVSDTLFYKNDVGTGFDATHWGIPKDRTKKPKLHTETKSEAVSDQAVETMGSYIQTLKDLDGREVKDTRKK